tara:strand:+ start:468 stop:821 length:354 start_codon:yes stop_codon:yes gene_type:complete
MKKYKDPIDKPISVDKIAVNLLKHLYLILLKYTSDIYNKHNVVIINGLMLLLKNIGNKKLINIKEIIAVDNPGGSITLNIVQKSIYSSLLSSISNPIVLNIIVNISNPKIKTIALRS